MSMFGSNPQRPRKFEYEPFYYNPESEKEHHFNFRRLRHSKLPKKANNVRLVVGVIILVAVIIYLQKMSKNPSLKETDPIKVQDVIVIE